MDKKFEFNERYPAINRDLVKGPGLSRRYLPNFSNLGSFGNDLIQESLKVIGRHTESYNDIGNDQTYKMSMESPLCKYFPNSYRQILLQRPVNQGENESDYIVDHHIELLGTIRKYFNVPFYRSRLAILPKSEFLDWHIDADTSVSCRVQFQIQGQSRWQINRKGKIEEKIISPGEIWFTNASFPHRVENVGAADRIALTVGCDYQDLQRLL